MFFVIGSISLNISFFLYLFLYVPQIVHNQKKNNIAELSFGLHILLFISYVLDLIYGFAAHFPWQYKAVSIVGFTLVLVQHMQLSAYFKGQQSKLYTYLSHGFIALNALALYWFFIYEQGVLSQPITVIFGSFARACGLVYCLPQIQKNMKNQSAKAISLPFIYLNLILSLLDTVSAWSLDWGWPNKLAAPLMVIFMLILRAQNKKYPLDLLHSDDRCADSHVLTIPTIRLFILKLFNGCF